VVDAAGAVINGVRGDIMAKINCIIYPPTLDFHYLVQRPQQLIKKFAEQNITSLFLNLPGIYERGYRGIDQINPYLYVFHYTEPHPYLQGIRPVVYYSAPAQVNLVQRYHPSLTVFDSVDEPSDEFAAWKPYYYRAVSLADLVICTSQKLYETALNYNPNVYLVPNGCDYDHFARSAGSALPPYDMRKLQGPVIGYIGAIASWCDLELIDRLACIYPNYNFVMIGPLYNVSTVPQRPNLHWLGFKNYEELPDYARCFDVGIIPFKNSSMIDAVNPIKMWEYLAAGMPVVTTAVPEAKKYEGILFYSQDEEAFLTNIQLALRDNSYLRREERLALARQNSWDARAERIIALIEYHLDKKYPQMMSSLLRIPDIKPFREQMVRADGAYGASPYQRLLIKRLSRYGPDRFLPADNYSHTHGYNMGKAKTLPAKTGFSRRQGLYIDGRELRRGSRIEWIIEY